MNETHLHDPILDVLRKKPMTFPALAGRLSVGYGMTNVPSNVIWKALIELTTAGEVSKTNDGKYAVVPTDKEEE